MTNLLALLDYDGVIINSINEKMFSGFNTYISKNNDTRLFNSEKLTFTNFNDTIKTHKTLVDKFRSLVSFIGLAGENACAFEIIEKSKVLPNNIREFRNLIDIYCNNSYDIYDELIIKMRKSYSQFNKNEFTYLSPPFYNIVDVIKKYSNQICFEIVTNKPIENVLFFNKEYEIESHINNIHYCNPNVITKTEIILKLIDDNPLKYRKIIFVDDLAHNLIPLITKGYNCYLADWGFERTELKKQAKNLGIKVLKQSKFKNLFKDNAS